MRKFVGLMTAALLLYAYVPQTYAQNKGGPPQATDVIVAPVKQQNFADKVEALGTAKANETVIITPDTSEKVKEIHFDDGQHVNKDDLLITLDKSTEEADLRAAEALKAERWSSYERAKGLQKSSALSKATLQQRLAEYQQSEADVEAIKSRIDELTITAPFDGVLGLRQVSVGTLVQPGDMITTIDDLSQIKVDFDVPSVLLPTLKPDLEIIGQVEGYGAREFKGKVTAVNSQVDPVTRTITVRAILANTDGALKPGLLMTITLLKNERQALLIPEEALIKRGEKNFVYVVHQDDGKTTAKQTEIEIGGRQPGDIEVLSGLQKDDQVVAHGTVKISDGSEIAIRAVEDEDAPLDELLKQTPAAGQQEKGGQ